MSKTNWPFIAVFLTVFSSLASAQWDLQKSQTTASLRGIHAVSDSVAWASGTNGTIVRTLDGGTHWQKCATPPGGESLDFRGIWVWDEHNAEVMSAGPGDQSRMFKTKDGCASWASVSVNTDKDGFWDAMVFQPKDFGMPGDNHTGVLIGDPVEGRFHTRVMVPGKGWLIDQSSCKAQPGEAAFAASNSSVFVFGSRRYLLVTGGKGGPRALLSPLLAFGDSAMNCAGVSLPITGGDDSSGAFAVKFRTAKDGVVVGGDYKKPAEANGTAAWTSDGGLHWTASAKPPHGYRSGLSFDHKTKSWIAVGSNGSDFSRDGGKNWIALDNGNWNAVSLPFAVGPNGRIGKLNRTALKR